MPTGGTGRIATLANNSSAVMNIATALFPNVVQASTMQMIGIALSGKRQALPAKRG
jgi:hypothetical protein